MEPQASWTGLARVKVQRDERDHFGLSGNMTVSFGASTVWPLWVMRSYFVGSNRLLLVTQCRLPRIRSWSRRRQFSDRRRDCQRSKQLYVFFIDGFFLHAESITDLRLITSWRLQVQGGCNQQQNQEGDDVRKYLALLQRSRMLTLPRNTVRYR